MGKANPCKVCNSDKDLKWKTYNEEEWWITCESCGSIGKPGNTMEEAGIKWNQDN